MLEEKLFGECRGPPSQANRDRSINLAVRVMVMVNCSAHHQSSGLLEQGPYQVPWRSDVSFSQFIADIFPVTDHPSLNDDGTGSSFGTKTALTARKLKKRAGLKFRPTNDLRRHLMLDQRMTS
jgi:hypothetical protein